MDKKEFFTTSEVARMLGVSRIAIFKQIKKGTIRARKSGRAYLVPKDELDDVLVEGLSEARKRDIDGAVGKVVAEYGQTLKLLGKE